MKMLAARPALMLVVLLGLQSCGGGGIFREGCDGGYTEISFEPNLGKSARGAWRLPYKLGQQNTWRVAFSANNGAACTDGIGVKAGSFFPYLPAGFAIDSKTGVMTSGVLSKPMEGVCSLDGTWLNKPSSVNQVCSPPDKFWPVLYAAIVYTDYINRADAKDGQMDTRYEFEVVQ